MPSPKGGDQFPLTWCIATPKAQVAYRELVGDPEADVGDVLGPLVGEVAVTAFADGSPYYILKHGPFRFVFCVTHRHEGHPERGRFALVNVQRRFSAGERE